MFAKSKFKKISYTIHLSKISQALMNYCFGPIAIVFHGNKLQKFD